MSGLSAEEPGSSPPTRGPDRAPASLLWWAGPRVRLRVSHVRENGRMICVCVTGSMQDMMRTHAEREKKKIHHLKRNKTKNGIGRKEILPLREADPQIPERKNFGYEKKKKSSSQDYFLFGIIVKLVLIDTGQCYWQLWSSSVLRCIWWLLGFFFLPPVCSFYEIFYFQLLVSLLL